MGLHFNLSYGRPVSDPRLVPSSFKPTVDFILSAEIVTESCAISRSNYRPSGVGSWPLACVRLTWMGITICSRIFRTLTKLWHGWQLKRTSLCGGLRYHIGREKMPLRCRSLRIRFYWTLMKRVMGYRSYSPISTIYRTDRPRSCVTPDMSTRLYGEAPT